MVMQGLQNATNTKSWTLDSKSIARRTQVGESHKTSIAGESITCQLGLNAKADVMNSSREGVYNPLAGDGHGITSISCKLVTGKMNLRICLMPFTCSKKNRHPQEDETL